MLYEVITGGHPRLAGIIILQPPAPDRLRHNVMNQPVPEPAPLDIFSASFLLPNVGAPFLVGLAVGYFAKKMLKLALFIGGAAVVLLFVGEYYGVTLV